MLCPGLGRWVRDGGSPVCRVHCSVNVLSKIFHTGLFGYVLKKRNERDRAGLAIVC